MFLLTHPVFYSANNVHSNSISSSPYFVFLSRKSPYTAGSRLHNTNPCYTSTYVIIIMLSAYMRFPGWSTGGPASLPVGSRPRTQIHTKMLLHYRPECIPPIHFAYILILLMVWDRYGIAPGMLMAQTNKIINIVASCLCWYGTVWDRYGIAPGVTQTNKQTNKQTPN